MEHVRQTDLIQLAADELADPRRAEVVRHLAGCAACQAQYQQQAAVWRALGEWTPEAAPRDLVAGIERKLADTPAASRPLWSRVGRLARIAAAVAIGVGAGHGAARNWPALRPGLPPVAVAEAEQAAMEALGVQYFEEPSPAGLYGAVQDLSAAAEAEEGQS